MGDNHSQRLATKYGISTFYYVREQHPCFETIRLKAQGFMRVIKTLLHIYNNVTEKCLLAFQ